MNKITYYDKIFKSEQILHKTYIKTKGVKIMKRTLSIILSIIMASSFVCGLPVYAKEPTNESAYIIGDTDLDGAVTIKDATLLQFYIAKLAKLTDKQLLLADVDHDNVNTIKDTTCIQLYLAHVLKNTDIGTPLKNNTDNTSKDAQARVIAQEIADASYKIAHKKNSNPSDLELVSIACELVSEYCKACTYTTSDSDYSTAYGVFIKRVYTCAGSVRALGMVLDCMGYSWKHVNENQWTHQWCELTMDGKKGWADAYNGYYFGELAIGAGYGDYDSHAGDDVFEHFGWYETLDYSGSEKSGKIVYKLTTWKAYYGLGDEELIEYFDGNGNFIQRQQKINGNLCFEYNVTTGKVTYFKSTVDFL